jgi:rod shape-determining protein MreD
VIARDRLPRGMMIFSTVVALALQFIPLPSILDDVRPPLLVLTVIYWSVAVPRAGGIALGFVAGLAIDVFKGAVLGQYALATSLIAYLSIRQHLLVRHKPVFEQALLVAVALAIYELVAWLIDGWSGHAMSGISRWLPILTGAVVWPVVTAVLGQTHARR